MQVGCVPRQTPPAFARAEIRVVRAEATFRWALFVLPLADCFSYRRCFYLSLIRRLGFALHLRPSRRMSNKFAGERNSHPRLPPYCTSYPGTAPLGLEFGHHRLGISKGKSGDPEQNFMGVVWPKRFGGLRASYDYTTL